jgi:hypothetical protein
MGWRCRSLLPQTEACPVFARYYLYQALEYLAESRGIRITTTAGDVGD